MLRRPQDHGDGEHARAEFVDWRGGGGLVSKGIAFAVWKLAQGMSALSATPATLDKDGMLQIPEGPGLGVSLNPDAVPKYGRGRTL